MREVVDTLIYAGGLVFWGSLFFGGGATSALVVVTCVRERRKRARLEADIPRGLAELERHANGAVR